METLILNIQAKLSEVSRLNSIDENSGQLDDYSPNFPVQWPCALIDISDATFTNIGKDVTKNPQNRQKGQVLVKITIANMKLTNTSLHAPIGQKETAWSIWNVISEVHKKLHGFYPSETSSKLLRSAFHRIKRDDGIQEYEIYYSFELNNA